MQVRKFIRYPTDTPVAVILDNIIGEHQLYMKDASQGGLCFNARACLDLGTHLNINIPFSPEAYNTMGKIAWCYPSDNGQCQLGIEFEKQLTPETIEKVVLKH